MWRYLLLGMPLLGLALFFVLAFELALFLYLLVVVCSLLLYYEIQTRLEITSSIRRDESSGVGMYKEP